MDDNRNGIVTLLERQGRANSSAKAAAIPEPDSDSEYIPFGHGQVATRPQLAIIFRKADGSAKAFSYAHLYSIESDNPDEGFTVEFTQSKVAIKGRNLEPLFRYISQHRAAEVIEAGRTQIFELAAEHPVIEKIGFFPMGKGQH
jgi:hypothetical protein